MTLTEKNTFVIKRAHALKNLMQRLTGNDNHNGRDVGTAIGAGAGSAAGALMGGSSGERFGRGLAPISMHSSESMIHPPSPTATDPIYAQLSRKLPKMWKSVTHGAGPTLEELALSNRLGKYGMIGGGLAGALGLGAAGAFSGNRMGGRFDKRASVAVTGSFHDTLWRLALQPKTDTEKTANMLRGLGLAARGAGRLFGRGIPNAVGAMDRVGGQAMESIGGAAKGVGSFLTRPRVNPLRGAMGTMREEFAGGAAGRPMWQGGASRPPGVGAAFSRENINLGRGMGAPEYRGVRPNYASGQGPSSVTPGTEMVHYSPVIGGGGRGAGGRGMGGGGGGFPPTSLSVGGAGGTGGGAGGGGFGAGFRGWMGQMNPNSFAGRLWNHPQRNGFLAGAGAGLGTTALNMGVNSYDRSQRRKAVANMGFGDRLGAAFQLLTNPEGVANRLYQ